MKRIFAVTLLLLITLLCGACGETKTASNVYNDLSFPLGEWGENQAVRLEEQEDGAVRVVNDIGETVLDVTAYPRTEILGDEFTGEPRLIKICTPSRIEEIDREGDFFHALPVNRYPDKGDCFAYSYYDTFGNLLWENIRYNLISISNTLGLSCDYSGNILVHQLETGVCLGSGLLAYPVESGVLMSGEEYNPGEAMAFYDYDGNVTVTDRMYSIVGYPEPYICSSAAETDSGWMVPTGIWERVPSWETTEQYASLLDSYDPESAEEEKYRDYRDDFADQMEERYGFRVHRDSLLIFRADGNPSSLCGLMDDKGNIVVEPKYKGFCSLGEDTVVAFAHEQTELYRRDDFFPVKTLPCEMSCYDGENAVVQTAEGKAYLADGEGNRISETYDRMERLDMEEYGVCFLAYPGDPAEAEVLNGEGAILCVISDDPSAVRYAGDGALWVDSECGVYTMDTEGNILWVMDVYNGYFFDQEKDAFYKAE